ncbi:hypothetical protein SNE40_004845 [Patella caerulea]|uniref:PiggyBac transposable element-derived protein domain-containing protein n=1 Tax=Patella caerulea TaxID=87958 RepID=A0AAN8Q1F2_PATCE
MDIKAIEKQPRGTYDFRSDNCKGIILTRWNDNNVVSLISNKYGIQPVGTATRWSKKDGKRVGIRQPNVVKHYNSTMGGVDRLDQNIGLYRCGINSKKWWWSLLLYLIDMCVQQTWHLYRNLPQFAAFPKDQLAVRREISKIWLMQAPPLSKPGRRGGKYASLDKRIPPQIRFDGQGHFIEKSDKQARCAACGMKCRQRCIKCNVGVHDRCFIQFHSS